MKNRKNPLVDLESRRGLFMQIGAVVALTLSVVAFEWKSYEATAGSLGDLNVTLEDEVIPLTKTNTPPPPPPPPAPPEVLTIVDNTMDIPETTLESTETDQNEQVEIIEEVGENTEVFDFVSVENRPVFPGCERESTEDAKFDCFQLKVRQFVAKETSYPTLARDMGIQGKVWVSFIIEKDGSIADVTIERGIDKSLDSEAVRVVKKFPSMIPAKVSGRSVRMRYSLPVNFTLQ
jgi:protein TonB